MTRVTTTEDYFRALAADASQAITVLNLGQEGINSILSKLKASIRSWQLVGAINPTHPNHRHLLLYLGQHFSLKCKVGFSYKPEKVRAYLLKDLNTLMSVKGLADIANLALTLLRLYHQDFTKSQQPPENYFNIESSTSPYIILTKQMIQALYFYDYLSDAEKYSADNPLTSWVNYSDYLIASADEDAALLTSSDTVPISPIMKITQLSHVLQRIQSSAQDATVLGNLFRYLLKSVVDNFCQSTQMFTTVDDLCHQIQYFYLFTFFMLFDQRACITMETLQMLTPGNVGFDQEVADDYWSSVFKPHFQSLCPKDDLDAWLETKWQLHQKQTTAATMSTSKSTKSRSLKESSDSGSYQSFPFSSSYADTSRPASPAAVSELLLSQNFTAFKHSSPPKGDKSLERQPLLEHNKVDEVDAPSDCCFGIC